MFSAMSRHSESSLVKSALRRSAIVLLAAAALLAKTAAQQPAPQVAAPTSAQPPQQAAPQDANPQPAQPAPQSSQPPAQQSTQPPSEQAAPAQEQPAAPFSAPTQPAAAQAPDQPPVAVPSAAGQVPAATQPQSAPAKPESGGITEDELKQLLAGKALYLRGGYLDDTLSFNEHGVLIGHSLQGSYTLCGVQIDKIRFTKHKVELVGARYGLHFLGALAYEDPTTAVDRVRITPKKKALKITIDREIVIKPKKEKKDAAAKAAPAAGNPPAPSAVAQPSGTSVPDAKTNDETNDADEAKAEIAAAPPEERPADPNSVTTTTSPAHAAKVLKDALDAIFSQGLDERLMASMPDFWKLYYQAAAAKTDYRPKDPAVLRQSAVDAKAKLLTTFEPASNEYAQASGVAGMALYHAVIGADGKPGEIAVARPIGFGLDESAVAAIRNAKFAPAIKNGQPVPVMLDLVVQFRIYSKRTAANGTPEEAAKPAEPILPGPYSVQHPPPQPQQ